MTSLPKNLLRYQRQRMVSGVWRIEGNLNGPYDACIVIPALLESQTLPLTLESLSNCSQEFLTRTIIIIVVNNRVDADSSIRNDNEQLLKLLRQYPDNKLQLAWIDASSPGRELPLRQGVGLARKIGFDLCLEHLRWQTKPFLVSLDADTLVHPNYLTALFQHFEISANGGAVIPFRHTIVANPEQESAIRHYELYLRSYTFGLQLAGSPYAYNSIGSAFACTAAAYLQAGGMNKRQAGEDFYFLQQLYKTSGIKTVEGGLVFPSSRPSARVPFGTGRAVSSQTDQGISLFTFCDKSAFYVLQQWLLIAKSQWQADSSELLQAAEEIDPQLFTFLERLNFSEVWSQLQKNFRDQTQFNNNFHCWFDGLRTRQLLTALTPCVATSAHELVNGLLRWSEIPEQESESQQLAILEQRQGVIVQP